MKNKPFLLYFFSLALFYGCNLKNEIVIDAKTVIGHDDDDDAVVVENCNFTPSTYMAASVVIGQPDMVSSSANQGLGVPTDKTIHFSDGVSYANDKLFIGDFSNKRYLVYNTIPTANNAAADMVLGQANFTSISTTVNDRTTSAGRGAVWTGSQLILTDGFNARLLVYNSFPTSSAQPADFVIGQSDFITATTGRSDTKINSGYGGISVADNKLWVSDVYNNRVVTFDLPITSNLPTASLVQGQANFTLAQTAVTDDKDYNGAAKVIFHDGKMIVADRYNSRVLIYNTIPTLSYTGADYVIGQTNFTNDTPNQGSPTPSAQSLNEPHAVAVDHVGRLYISDTLNHRVLIYNSIPTSNNAAADYVIGQSGFTTKLANAGGVAGDKTISRATDLIFANCSLIVADQSNSRVLVFK